MPDGTSLISHLFSSMSDVIRAFILLFAGLFMFKAKAQESVSQGVAHFNDAAGVSVAAVVVADNIGVVDWLAMINVYMQTGIVFLTLVWMVYRIVQIHRNLRVKSD